MAEIRVHLDDMAYNGSAVGRLDGKAVFVPGGIPGEDVLVEIVEDRRRYALARLVQVLAASPERVAPPCPYYGRCGGCQWQHIAYDAQLRFKTHIVRGQLERIGRIRNPPVRPTIGMADPWAYRNNMQFVVDGVGRLCLLAQGTNRPVPIGDCRLLCPELREVYADLQLEVPGLKRVALRAGRATGERMLVLEAQGPAPEIDFEEGLGLSCVLLRPDGTGAALIGEQCFHEEVGGRRLRVSAGSFFQVNTEQAARLVALVQEHAAVGPNDVVLDAYGGVGTLGLALAGQAREVIIVEGNPAAVADARANAEGTPNVRVIEAAVEEVLPRLPDGVTVAVLDPPRAGVASAALEALVSLRPQRVVYVSCDPGTLARDLGALLDRGYGLEVVQPLDMFPQTYHVECVASLSFGGEGGRRAIASAPAGG